MALNLNTAAADAADAPVDALFDGMEVDRNGLPSFEAAAPAAAPVAQPPVVAPVAHPPVFGPPPVGVQPQQREPMQEDLCVALRSAKFTDSMFMQLKAFFETQELLDLETFVNWITDPADAGTFCSSSPLAELRAPVVTAKLRALWRKEFARAESKLKEPDATDEDAAFDLPMPAGLAKQRRDRAMSRYAWTRIDNRRFGSDVWYHRFCREFDAGSPCFTDFEKFKTLAFAKSHAPPVTEKLTDGTSLVHHGKHADSSSAVYDLVTMFQTWDVIGRTWAAAGIALVSQSSAKDAPRAPYADFCDIEEYFFAFSSRLSKLRRKYSDSSIFAYFREVEAQMRRKAVETARGSDRHAWGFALLSALRTEASLWTSEQNLLTRKKGASEDPRDFSSGDSEPAGKRGGKRATKTKRKREPSNSAPAASSLGGSGGTPSIRRWKVAMCFPRRLFALLRSCGRLCGVSVGRVFPQNIWSVGFVLLL